MACVFGRRSKSDPVTPQELSEVGSRMLNCYPPKHLLQSGSKCEDDVIVAQTKINVAGLNWTRALEPRHCYSLPLKQQQNLFKIGNSV